MTLKLQFLDGARVAQHLEYGDDVARVDFGRDPAKCRVVFPADQTIVGREHFGLRREVGRYRLVLNGSHQVLVDGQPGRDGQEIPVTCELQLGVGGPRLKATTTGNVELPSTMPNLQKVPGAPGRDTMVRGLDKSLKQTKVFMAVALVAFVGVIVVLGVGFYVMYQAGQQKIVELEEKHKAVMGDMNERMQGLREKIQPRIQEALTKAAPSVYLVVLRDDKGKEAGQATAWAVGAGVLATNAHVAEIFNTVKPGWTLLARSNATPPVDFVIKSVSIHPGYAEFQKIWADYRPTKDSIGPTIEQLQQVVACDVALMVLENGDGLAAPLALADLKTIEALGAGDVIGYVGYPMESMAMGGVNVKQPTPQMQVGNVTAITDFFLMKSHGGAQLVQNSLPIMGGASGSPIFNAEGKVIALVSAANLTYNPTTGSRISTGAGVNFGQRADLLLELLDGGNVEEKQKTRSDQWRQDIRQFASLRDKIVDVLAARWLQSYPGRQLTRIATESGTVAKPLPRNANVFTWQAKVSLPASGPCYVVAVSGNDKTIETYVFDAPGQWTDNHLIGRDAGQNWYGAVNFNLLRKLDVEVVISSTTKDTPVTIHVFQATSP